MKKLNKIIISLALVLILALPVFVSGCTGGDKEGIKIYSNFKTEYSIGETLDLTDGKIEYTDKDGKETVVEITTQMVTAFNTDTVGNRSLIITYKGNTCTVNYTVYRIADLEVGACYRNAPSILGAPTPENYYDVIKVTSANELKMTMISITSYDSFDWNSNNLFVLNVTRSIVNKKAVYTFSGNIGASAAQVVITVVNDNTLNLVATNVGTNETHTTTLTKVA